MLPETDTAEPSVSGFSQVYSWRCHSCVPSAASKAVTHSLAPEVAMTIPPATVTLELMRSGVTPGCDHAGCPVSASTAYTLPSAAPKYTTPPVTAGPPMMAPTGAAPSAGKLHDRWPPPSTWRPADTR